MTTDQLGPAGPPSAPGTVPAVPHPIELESYRIVSGRVDLSAWRPGPAAVAARVIHATADPSLIDHLVVPEAAVEAGVAALRSGAPVLCDVDMVRAGISVTAADCYLARVTDPGPFPTRSAAAMAAAAERHRSDAVFVVGCAPTALAELVRLLGESWFRPALVIGVPVGYVGAADAKAALLLAAPAAGVPAIVLRGERGGAAIAAAITNALGRLAAGVDSGLDLGPGTPPSGPQGDRPTGGPNGCGGGTAAAPVALGARPPAGEATGAPPAMVLMGHGTRSPAGEAELRAFAHAVAAARPDVDVRTGFIEFMEPDLDGAIDNAVAAGAQRIVGLPLVLLGAGHLKDDGPAALTRASARHRQVAFTYARDFGVHPLVLSTIGDRIAAAGQGFPGQTADAVVIVGRGSTDPDANADLAKAARLLADGRSLGTALQAGLPDGVPTPPLGLVEPAFVSLARPGVGEALDRCFALGARRIAVVPYFFFAGLLTERIEAQAARWAGRHPGTDVVCGPHMGIDARLVTLAWERFDEAARGQAHMNCDGCLYRAPLPGYEHRVGAAPFTPSVPG